MTKRGFVLLLTMAYLFSANSFAQIFKGNGFQQIKIGDIEGVVLSDGSIPFSTVQPAMAPTTAKDSVSNLLKEHLRSETSFELALNILLLKKSDRLILLDAGQGNGMGDDGGWLVSSLSVLGITPEQITDIVISHAHLDHIGGLINGDGKSIYPNATLYTSRVEYDFWTKGTPDFSKSKLKDEAMVASMVKFVRTILASVQPQLKLIEDNETILDCINVSIVPGHTDGHLVSTVSSKDDKLVLISDVIHSDVILFAHPEWGNGFDSNFNLGISSRIRLLKELNDANALIFGFHLPYPGIGHIKKVGNNSYEWMPSAFYTPQIK